MATTTLLHPYPYPLPAAAVRYLCRIWWTCYSAPPHTWRVRCDALLATGQLLSVIPRMIQDDMNLAITPEPGWSGQVPTWFGIPCQLGRVTAWLPAQDHPGHYRPLSVLALFPKDELTDAPPFIHLGTQFLLEHRAQVHLDCASAGNAGRLVIP
jgi:hypothetical protein